MMVKELRIGNILVDELTGAYLEVCELGENIGTAVIDRSKFPLPDGWRMAPLKLAPEILEKSGFMKVQMGWDMPGSQFSLYQPNQIGKILACSREFVISNMLIETLHQLQNLYFCLTGEELTVQL